MRWKDWVKRVPLRIHFNHKEHKKIQCSIENRFANLGVLKKTILYNTLKYSLTLRLCCLPRRIAG